MSVQASTLFKTVNPKNARLMCSFDPISSKKLDELVHLSYNRFRYKQALGVEFLGRRCNKLRSLATSLEENKQFYAEMITTECGKPITGSLMEIEFCLRHLNYYIDNSETFVENEEIAMANGQKGQILYQPLGPLLAIMPYNFPFYNVIKATLPSLLLGNSILLKHSQSCPQSALALEELFEHSGFGRGEFQNAFIINQHVNEIIADRRIRAVKFAGGTPVGKQIAKKCGQMMKLAHFELSSNDSFIVMDDADMEKAVAAAYQSRMLNGGQSVIAAQRFIIHEKVYEEFRHKLVEKIKTDTIIGDPMDPKTTLGPLGVKGKDIAIKNNVRHAVEVDGANLVYGDLDFTMGGDLADGFWVTPYVIENQPFDSESSHQEHFGPVFELYRVKDEAMALQYANRSNYGHGCTIFSENPETCKNLATRARVGIVSINQALFRGSDFPSGGIKDTGYGLDSHREGILEISNRKSLINKLW